MNVVLDDFRDVSGWLRVASGLAQLTIATEPGPSGTAMRLHFDFKGGGGFVVARKSLSVSSISDAAALLSSCSMLDAPGIATVFGRRITQASAICAGLH